MHTPERQRSSSPKNSAWLIPCFTVLGVLLANASVAQAQNQPTNGGFEQDSIAPIGAPDGWTLSAWIPSLVSTTLDTSVKHEGNRSLRVSLSAHMQISGGWERLDRAGGEQELSPVGMD